MSFMYNVTINGVCYFAEDGELLSSLLMRCGIDFPHPCSGRGACQKCRVTVDGEEALSCQYVIRHDATVTLPRSRELTVKEFDTPSDLDGAVTVLDIGTTTLIMALVSRDGKIIKRVGATNPQTVFGADVISRIEQCKNHSLNAVREPLIRRINEMIRAIGHPTEKMFVAANTTMLHIFAGEDCSSIGRAPYTARFLDLTEKSGKELSIDGIESVILLPSAHAFVGADVLAGLACAEMPEEGKYSIFLDLGTNAEIVLFSNKSAICTAAAAGPCFEGSNIECGMSALPGAICSFSLIGGSPSFETVGGVDPTGICATGLIDLIFELLRIGEIDETGYMEDNYRIKNGVYLSPADVRQLQLAKSAVHSAIEALMDIAGIGYGDIETLYVSGGFASKLSVTRAAAIGLIPMPLSHKCKAFNDSCLEGTAKFAMGIPLPFERAEYCDLTRSSVFSQKFIDNMTFEI